MKKYWEKISALIGILGENNMAYGSEKSKIYIVYI